MVGLVGPFELDEAPPFDDELDFYYKLSFLKLFDKLNEAFEVEARRAKSTVVRYFIYVNLSLLFYFSIY